jgi:hypothetical protein
MVTSRSAEIAQTILEQLGNGKFKVMTGAKHFMALPIGQGTFGGLSFRLPGAGGFCKNSINYVSIELTPMDEYVMTFSRIRSGDVKVISMHRDIQCDQLREIFEQETGLRTSLGVAR